MSQESKGSRRSSEGSPDSSTVTDIVDIAALAVRLGKKIAATASVPAGVITPTKNLLEALAKLRASVPALESYLSELEHGATLSFQQLEADLRDDCATRAWHLDGQWPALYVQRAILVQLDERQRTAEVGGARVVKATVEAITQELEPLVHALVPAGFSPERFLAELAAAYDEARGTSAQVPVFEVYRRMVTRSQKPRFWRNASSKDFVELSADQFRARLSISLEIVSATAPDGRQLRITPPINPKEGLFVYQPSEQRFGFIGHIEFVEASGQ